MVVNLAKDTATSVNTSYPTLPSASSTSNATSVLTRSTITPSPALQRPPSGISRQDKVAIGAVIPIVGIASFLLFMIFLWRKRKRSQQAKNASNSADSSEGSQPYFQQKAELDSEETRRLELDAHEPRFEMDTTQSRHEVEGAHEPPEASVDGRWQRLVSLGRRHELRGEEHAKELEGPEMLRPNLDVEPSVTRIGSGHESGQR